MIRRLAVLALVAAACSASTGTTAQAPPQTTPATVTASTQTDIATTDCETPPEEFGVFCEAYELIIEEYVDGIDPAVLAAGAASGLETFRLTGGSSPSTCVEPEGSFGPYCDAYATVLGDNPGVDLVEASLRGMVELGLGDPYSAYLTPETLRIFEEDGSGTVQGIGALVTSRGPDGEVCPLLGDDCVLVVVSTLDGSPAERAGVLTDDIIFSVDGVEVGGFNIEETAARVRGPAGTDVTLQLDRAGEQITITITRTAFEVPAVEHEVIDGHVGYLRLGSFPVNSPKQVRRALEELLQQDVGVIVLDVQDNPGGSLTAAVAITSEFLSTGQVLRTEGPGESRVYDVARGGLATDPGVTLIVLVNRGSASATEVVSSALQEAGRAVVIGEPTFGKNTVQQTFHLSNGGALKLTIARWLTPDGVDFGENGVQPDVLIEIPPAAEDGFLLEQALAWLASS